jgi:hypothetical protein
MTKITRKSLITNGFFRSILKVQYFISTIKPPFKHFINIFNSRQKFPSTPAFIKSKKIFTFEIFTIFYIFSVSYARPFILENSALGDRRARVQLNFGPFSTKKIDEAQKAKWDNYAIHKAAIDSGLAQGSDQRARKIAKKMLLDNESVEKTVKYTELSEADVLAIKATLSKL